MEGILYIVSTLKKTGPTNQLYYICKHLNDNFDISILTLSPEPEDSDCSRFNKLDITFNSLELSRMASVTVAPRKLDSFVSTNKPDIIHTQGIRADTLSALFLQDYPHVATIRNYAYEDYPSKFGLLQGNLMALEHLQVLSRVDAPVACSRTIAKRVQKHGIDASAIQNGVNKRKYTPASQSEQRRLRNKLDLPDDKHIFISVGPLIPRKDPRTVIEGFSRSRIKSSSNLVFLGEGPLRSSCESLVDDELVQFEGWVDNVEEYLKAADFFVSASKSEGLPNAVMEALASGLPAVLSNIDPHKEIIGDSPAGITFKCGDPDSLVSSLENLTSKEYNMISTAARHIIEKNLSAEGMAREYQNLYTEILETSNQA